MSFVVKRRGHIERFDERKVYASIYAACASAHYNKIQCGKTAKELTKLIKKFVKNQKEINSVKIRKKIESELKKKDKELAFFYEHHLPNLRKL